MQRVTFGDHDAMLLVPIGACGFQPLLDDLLDFFRLVTLCQQFETLLFLGQFADGFRVNAFKLLGEVVTFLHQRDVGGAKLIQLGFLDDAIGVQCPSTIALDVKGLMFSRDFLLGCVFEF
jgi:hypothetical protein